MGWAGLQRADSSYHSSWPVPRVLASGERERVQLDPFSFLLLKGQWGSLGGGGSVIYLPLWEKDKNGQWFLFPLPLEANSNYSRDTRRMTLAFVKETSSLSQIPPTTNKEIGLSYLIRLPILPDSLSGLDWPTLCSHPCMHLKWS